MYMRVFLISLFFVGTLSARTIPVVMDKEAHDADWFISRHNNAIGGIDALMSMQTISRHGFISFYEQEQGQLQGRYCYHTDIFYPNRLREQIKGNEILYDRGTNGVTFWSWIDNQYESINDQNLIDYMQSTAERANRDLLWLTEEYKNLHSVSRRPSWAPNDSQCIKGNKVSTKEKRYFCFDNSTGLLNSSGDTDEYRLLSDWRKINDIKLPFHLQHYQQGQMVYKIQLELVEIDKVISDEQFNFPSYPGTLSCE